MLAKWYPAVAWLVAAALPLVMMWFGAPEGWIGAYITLLIGVVVVKTALALYRTRGEPLLPTGPWRTAAIAGIVAAAAGVVFEASWGVLRQRAVPPTIGDFVTDLTMGLFVIAIAVSMIRDAPRAATVMLWAVAVASAAAPLIHQWLLWLIL